MSLPAAMKAEPPHDDATFEFVLGPAGSGVQPHAHKVRAQARSHRTMPTVAARTASVLLAVVCVCVCERCSEPASTQLYAAYIVRHTHAPLLVHVHMPLF